MDTSDEKPRTITIRCDGELKRRAKMGAGRRDENLSEYLRELITEDTNDIPTEIVVNTQSTTDA